jgi:hypothetical protein
MEKEAPKKVGIYQRHVHRQFPSDGSVEGPDAISEGGCDVAVEPVERFRSPVSRKRVNGLLTTRPNALQLALDVTSRR